MTGVILKNSYPSSSPFFQKQTLRIQAATTENPIKVGIRFAIQESHEIGKTTCSVVLHFLFRKFHFILWQSEVNVAVLSAIKKLLCHDARHVTHDSGRFKIMHSHSIEIWLSQLPSQNGQPEIAFQIDFNVR